MKTQKKHKYSVSLISSIVSIVFLLIAGTLNSQPAEDWQNRYNGYGFNDKPKKMIMDYNGDMIISGSSEGKDESIDILTVKYASDGKELWSARFSGETNHDGSDDEANSIAVDSKGSVYVTGSTHSGVIGRDYCTIKYSSDGKEEWVRIYSGEGRIEDSDESAVAITTDKSDFIYVTGYSNGRGDGYEFSTIKYNFKGEQIWQRTSENITGKPSDIKTDRDGNILITGYCNTALSGKDFVTLKYNSDGDQLWMETYNGTGRNVVNNDDEAFSISADTDEMIYITGYSYGINTGKDFLTIKYSSDGYEQWVSRTDSHSDNQKEAIDDIPVAAETDKSGNIFITGKTISPVNGGSDFMTVKINSDGKRQWTKTYDSPQFVNTEDAAEDLAIDSYGNVIVTGYSGPVFFNSSCGRGKFFCTIKYGSDGKEKWVKEYSGTGNFETSNNSAKGILIDIKNRIYVMGESMGEETNMDFCIVRYKESLRDLNLIESLTGSKDSFRLNDNFPNPFNPSTKISFSIPTKSIVSLRIYDITGKEVAMLVNTLLTKGVHQFEWNATQFASGTYFYKIQTDEFIQTKKMLLIK